MDARAGEGRQMERYTCDEAWEMMSRHQDEEFLTVKGLPFSYRVKGGEMFISRRSKSITKSTFDAAYRKVLEAPELVTGPKKLGVFGAPYLWAVFKKLGLLEVKEREEEA